MNTHKNSALDTFVELGHSLRAKVGSGELDGVIAESVKQNRWFTQEYVETAFDAIITQMLDRDALSAWVSKYDIPAKRPSQRVGVIMAGNIPMVGFADLLAVVVSGNRCMAKLSSKDHILMDFMIGELKSIDPDIAIETVSEPYKPDALIATGNDNTIRSLRVKYGNIPAIFRGSRTSIAILTGQETAADLKNLAKDIFTYCGLGCRNVNHIFVPHSYDPSTLSAALSEYPVKNCKYTNNYLQNKVLSILNSINYLDGGFFTLTHTDEPRSDNFLSQITYSYYDSPTSIKEWLAANNRKIQCVVTGNHQENREFNHPRQVKFGQSQHPALTDYADSIDTMEFLCRL